MILSNYFESLTKIFVVEDLSDIALQINHSEQSIIQLSRWFVDNPLL